MLQNAIRANYATLRKVCVAFNAPWGDSLQLTSSEPLSGRQTLIAGKCKEGVDGLFDTFRQCKEMLESLSAYKVSRRVLEKKWCVPSSIEYRWDNSRVRVGRLSNRTVAVLEKRCELPSIRRRNRARLGRRFPAKGLCILEIVGNGYRMGLRGGECHTRRVSLFLFRRKGRRLCVGVRIQSEKKDVRCKRLHLNCGNSRHP